MFKRLKYNYYKNKQYKHVVQDVINYCKTVVKYGINGQIKRHKIEYLGDEQYPILISKEKVDSSINNYNEKYNDDLTIEKVIKKLIESRHWFVS